MGEREQKMNDYLKALQDEHLILESVLERLGNQAQMAAELIRGLFREKRADRIVFAAMGSSLYAARGIVSRLCAAGTLAIAYNGYELLHYNMEAVDEKTILFLVSQSGSTPEICELNRLCAGKTAHTVSFVNEEECALRGQTETELFLGMGKETPISNKTYYAQVAFFNLMAQSLEGKDLESMYGQLRQAIAVYQDYVEHQEEYTRPLMEFLKGCRVIDLLGDDAQGGAAFQAGLVLRELPRLPASSMSLSDYSHGWFDIAGENYAVVLFADKLRAVDERMIRHCLQCGGKVLLISPDNRLPGHKNLLEYRIPNAANSLLPLYSIVPVYFMAGMMG